jgi:DNA primase
MNFKTDNIDYLTKENILNKITEEDIFRRYVPFTFDINRLYNSPLRNDDNTPSFGIYDKFGTLKYKDFGGSQGSCFDFVMNYFNLSFGNCLSKINQDFNLNLIAGYGNSINSNTSKIISRRQEVSKSKKLLQVILRRFQKEDYEYWQNFGITKEILKFYNIRAIKEVYLDKRLHWTNTRTNPIYGYYFPKTNNIKCYKPLEKDKKNKWLGNVISDDIQGYEQLPETGDLLVITKSMKDVMCLYSIGINAIAPQGEDHHIPEELIEELRLRFKRIVIFYDNDSPGVNASIKVTTMYNLPYANIPKGLPKDPAEYYEQFGKDKLIEFCKLKQLI